jgi:DNA-binding LytR/AlgR family response regulator
VEQLQATLDEAKNDKAFLHLTSGHRVVKILFSDIYYIEARGNHLLTYTRNGVFKTYLAMSKLEEILPPEIFARIHRSFIVALDKIDSYTSSLVVIGPTKVPIGRSYTQKVKTYLANT